MPACVGTGAPAAERVRQAAAASLAAAATKAKALTEAPAREVQQAVLGIAELLAQRISAKLKYCDALDAALARERDSLQVGLAQKVFFFSFFFFFSTLFFPSSFSLMGS